MNRLYNIILLLLTCFAAHANVKPYLKSVPNENIGEAESYNYQIIVADSDNDTLTLILNEKPDWLNYVDYGNDTALLRGVPITKIDNFVSISVTDGKDTVIQEFNITVNCYNVIALKQTPHIVYCRHSALS